MNEGTTMQTSENNVDEIGIRDCEKVYAVDHETEAQPTTYAEWVTKSAENEGDSFFSVGEDYRTWSHACQIVYLEAQCDWHKQITEPLATFLLDKHSDRITHEINNMYELAVTLMTENLTEPSATFAEWEKSYRTSTFVTLSSTALSNLTKEELEVYIIAERKEHLEINRPLYEYVMQNHYETYSHCGSIQAAILTMLKR